MTSIMESFKTGIVSGFTHIVFFKYELTLYEYREKTIRYCSGK